MSWCVPRQLALHSEVFVALGAIDGSAPPEERYDVTYASVDFDRPFGFLAVHRPSRLAVVAGWVKTPSGLTKPRPQPLRDFSAASLA